jgi:hypothetical protein
MPVTGISSPAFYDQRFTLSLREQEVGRRPARLGSLPALRTDSVNRGFCISLLMLASVVLSDSLDLLIFFIMLDICTHLATRLFATAHMGNFTSAGAIENSGAHHLRSATVHSDRPRSKSLKIPQRARLTSKRTLRRTYCLKYPSPVL